LIIEYKRAIFNFERFVFEICLNQRAGIGVNGKQEPVISALGTHRGIGRFFLCGERKIFIEVFTEILISLAITEIAGNIKEYEQ
jgi:hypothetical protein